MPKRTSRVDTGAKTRRLSTDSTIELKRTTKARHKAQHLTSRAVLREVEPGSAVECVHCSDRIKFQARMHHKQVICNVYVAKRWDRVEHFHAPCYDEAGEPYGEADTTPAQRRPKSARAAEAAKAQTTGVKAS